MRIQKTDAFTLVEMIAAITLFVAATALALSGYMYLIKNTSKNDVQNELNNDAQNAIEHLKRDIRLSSMNEIHFFSESGDPPYEAISFPIAYDSDGDGVLERDSEGKIIWDDTVIYHIRKGSPDQLVRTTFSPRDNTLLGNKRQAQLNEVRNSGTASGADNGANAKSKIIFSNLQHWEISPNIGSFNCYSPSPIKERIGMGYYLLGSGPHDFKFTISGKDNDSTDYNIGIDTITASPSYIEREAEDQLGSSTLTYSGSKPGKDYASSYSGKNRLYVEGNDGDSFTLTLNNDRWEETNFGGRYSMPSNTVVKTHFDSTTSPIDADIVVELDGNKRIWEAEVQTSDFTAEAPTNSFNKKIVRVIMRGANIVPGGNLMEGPGMQTRFRFQASPLSPLKIENVLFAESISSNTISATVDPTTAQKVWFYNGASLDNFTEIAAGGFARSDWLETQIDPGKNYVITYSIPDDPTSFAPAEWIDNTAEAYLLAPCTHIGSLVGSTLDQANVAYTANWSTISSNDLHIAKRRTMLGLHSVRSSYGERGTYTSKIVDTKLDSVSYARFGWNSDLPAGTKIGYKIRSGMNPALVGTPGFDTISADYPTLQSSDFGISSAGDGRYVQFQAILDSSAAKGLATPRLRNTYISWTGEDRMMELSGVFSKGPDFGNFALSIDGKGLQSALVVDLEIYKDVRGHKGTLNRISAQVKAALTPRNSGL